MKKLISLIIMTAMMLSLSSCAFFVARTDYKIKLAENTEYETETADVTFEAEDTTTENDKIVMPDIEKIYGAIYGKRDNDLDTFTPERVLSQIVSDWAAKAANPENNLTAEELYDGLIRDIDLAQNDMTENEKEKANQFLDQMKEELGIADETTAENDSMRPAG